MKILKSFILSVVIYAVAVGCSSKESVAPACKLSVIVYYTGEIDTYSYTNNKLTSIDGTQGVNTETDALVYDTHGRLATETYIYDGGDTTVITFSYDTNNRLAQWEQTESEKVIYTYNSYGQVSKVQLYFYNGVTSSYELESYQVYTYPNTTTKNYSSIINYDPTDVIIGTYIYTWDNKHNPLQSVYFGEVETDSNLLQSIVQYGSSSPVTTIYSYTYNDNGYPLTRTHTVPGAADEVTVYSYTNCNY